MVNADYRIDNDFTDYRGGGGAQGADPYALVSNSRSYNMVNPASLASGIVGAAGGDGNAVVATRESVRSLLTNVENAQLDAALANIGYGNNPPAAPAPAALAPVTIPLALPNEAGAQYAAPFNASTATMAERTAYYSSAAYRAEMQAYGLAVSNAMNYGGDPIFDNYTMNSAIAFESNKAIMGYQQFTQWDRNLALQANERLLNDAQQKLAAAGYNMTIADVRTLATNGVVTMTSDPSNPGIRTSTNFAAANNLGSSFANLGAGDAITVVGQRSVVNNVPSFTIQPIPLSNPQQFTGAASSLSSSFYGNGSPYDPARATDLKNKDADGDGIRNADDPDYDAIDAFIGRHQSELGTFDVYQDPMTGAFTEVLVSSQAGDGGWLRATNIDSKLAARGITNTVDRQRYVNADFQAHQGSARARAYFGSTDQLTEYLYQNNWTIGQFEQRLHVLDLANLSSGAYTNGAQNSQYAAVSPGRFGLTPADFEMGNGFKATLSQNGDRYVLAFAGTNPISLSDIATDARQFFGLPTGQYDAAVKLANDLSGKIGLGNLEFTGHSLGGGLATVAAGVTGRSATTFNAAPLENSTLSRYGLAPNMDVRVTNYYVTNDIVTNSSIIPGQNLIGTQIQVGSALRYANQGLFSFFNHLTSAVISALTPVPPNTDSAPRLPVFPY